MNGVGLNRLCAPLVCSGWPLFENEENEGNKKVSDHWVKNGDRQGLGDK